jgi:hypothetical protein
VQRDILPIVEGTTVNTRYGFVRTDHILFMAAGAFHVSKPADMIPELQGRFPIRVELKSLTVEDFIRILREPKNALAKQYTALMETEGIKLTFTDDALEEVAKFAAQVNQSSENIGARRLHTIMEKLLEEVSFEGPDLKKKTVGGRRLRAQAASRHRQGSGSQPLHLIGVWPFRGAGPRPARGSQPRSSWHSTSAFSTAEKRTTRNPRQELPCKFLSRGQRQGTAQAVRGPPRSAHQPKRP